MSSSPESSAVSASDLAPSSIFDEKGLVITPATPGVVADLFDAGGGAVARRRSLISLQGEEAGTYTEALDRVANLYEEESLVVLESVPKFIGPAVVLIVGIVVLYLFCTVYIAHYLKPLLEGVGM